MEMIKALVLYYCGTEVISVTLNEVSNIIWNLFVTIDALIGAELQASMKQLCIHPLTYRFSK